VYTVSTSKDNWVYVFDAEGNDAEGRENIYVYSPSDPRFDNSGNIAEFYVKSYRYRANDQNYIEPLPWKASHGGSYSYKKVGSNDVAYPEENPDLKKVEADKWITDTFQTPLSGKGSSTKNQWEEHILDFLPHFVTTNWKGDEDMQGYPHYSGYSKEKPYDLSTFGGPKTNRNTANCYIIDRGGWYCFPMVYGNAIVNGAVNSKAYTSQSSATGIKIKKNLSDYKDTPITSAYITVPTGAKADLVWEDAYCLIEDYELVTIDGEQMIRFYVESEDLQQGNAIIALTESNGTIIWSWHIWATEHWLDTTTRKPHVFDKTNASFTTFKANKVTKIRERGDVAVTYNQKERTFMMAPYNLGWCDPKNVVYLKRKNQMDYVQYMPDGVTKTSLTDSLPIIQMGETVEYKYANNTYYQWGRKDPMRGYFNHEDAKKRVFGSRQPTIEAQGDITLGKGIQTPHVFYGKAGSSDKTDARQDWLKNGGYSNLWNNHANIGIEAVDNDNYREDLWCHEKTVYDPCPAGYMVPNAGIWHVLHNRSDFSWAGTKGDLEWFKSKINGAYIDDYNYKIWGNETGGDANAIFFSS
ncbi:MAG: hypothetical protein K2H18_04510, partial [Muribaculaceae bacterium]|nr:hypothetical protein [Muribaculaceae bacterium]